MKTSRIILRSLAMLSSHEKANNEDPEALCNSAAQLFKEGDMDSALEEARWCINPT